MYIPGKALTRVSDPSTDQFNLVKEYNNYHKVVVEYNGKYSFGYFSETNYGSGVRFGVRLEDEEFCRSYFKVALLTPYKDNDITMNNGQKVKVALFLNMELGRKKYLEEGQRSRLVIERVK